jgi:hypothetical protein
MVYIIGGVLLMLKTTQYTCNTPYKLSQKYNGFHNQNLKGKQYLHHCDNILNHETKGYS